MISVTYLFDDYEAPPEEVDDPIKQFMGDLGKSLREHFEKNKSEGERLKEKIDREREREKEISPWLRKRVLEI